MKDPVGIENKSMDIIEEIMKNTPFSLKEQVVVKRMIHTTGDFQYRNITVFQNNFIKTALNSIRKKKTIFTDTKMAFMGINKNALAKSGCSLRCYIDEGDVYEESKKRKTTRSACAIEKAVMEGIDVFVIGNAPTALFRLLELVKEEKIAPEFIVGVPVGFVGAKESKEYLRKFNISNISTIGTKGGSNVAASIVNALLYMAVGR